MILNEQDKAEELTFSSFDRCSKFSDTFSRQLFDLHVLSLKEI